MEKQMRRLIGLFIVLIIGGSVYYTVTHGWKNLFIPDSVKQVKAVRIEVLLERALEAEEDIKNDPKSVSKAASAFETIGKRYVERKEWTPAIKYLKKAIEYGSGSGHVHYSIALAYANRGVELQEKKDYLKAEYHYKRSIKVNPKSYDSIYGMAILYYYKLNKKEEAYSKLEYIIKKKPSYYRAKFALARFYYEENKQSKSLWIYRELYDELKSKPNSKQIEEYLKKCDENITRLQTELLRNNGKK